MNIRRGLLSISRWLGSFPSLGYALIYLSLIPIFAFIFYSLPNHFYHATIQNESVVDETFERTKTQLFKKIRDDFQAGQPYSSVMVKGWEIQIESLDNFKLENNQCTFDINIEASAMIAPSKKSNKDKMEPAEEHVGRFPIHVTLGIGEQETTNSNIQPVKIRAEINISQGLLSDIFLQIHIKRAVIPKASDGKIELPKQLVTDMRGYIIGKQGYGSSIEGNLWRMLYLSAVTITTVGYGDIVPLTNIARILVSVEAILGIVLIGLFLNSLSYERALMEELLKKEKAQEKRRKTILENHQKAEELIEKNLKLEESSDAKN